MTNIIACIDGSALSEYVTTASVWAAKQMGCSLTLLHSLEKDAVRTDDDLSGSIGFGSREHLLDELVALDEKRAKLALEHGKIVLENARAFANKAGAKLVEELQRHGDLVENLLDLEEETRLVVIGRLGISHTMDAHTVGSHIERVARTLHKPILISVGKFNTPKNFMIAYDGREAADNAIARIAQSPLLIGLPCHLVMAGDDTPERRAKLEEAQTILEEEGFEVISSIRPGKIYPVLTQYREENKIELMAMGAYAHSKVRQFFVGSNTTKMIIESDIPLLILR
ncbi:universal stress protein UspA [Marinomonas primoryensis]|mgnify:CR=1 FL=1|jgi:nucleotide-binding universal stress UspA family protein|uniref:Universal stress protein UspA n=1 Tax=Marinomonas primoryensis TaxID=178399 RepID=A0A2Z4PST5_9GAMM|nr:universal stress protein [Marinomonas primoryensis]AWY00485.1 universal stress protein UspA [Marinomonas primoryensis]